MSSGLTNNSISTPDDWKWSLRLFASVDLVGSTSFKAKKNSDFPEWAHVFSAYFEDFPNHVEKAYDTKLKSKHDRSPKESKFEVWKHLGDEILFSVELQRHTDALYHIYYFKNAISTYKSAIKEKQLPLSLKGTAWIAGFPVLNTRVKIPTNSQITIDYIGPQIDLGFRLAGLSSERNFVLSIDLAMMILDSVHTLEIKEDVFWIALQKKALLKGILGGEEYPIVFLHMENGSLSDEEKLLGVKNVYEKEVLLRYITNFIDSKYPLMYRPFIENDANENYNKIPEAFVKRRNVLMDTAKDTQYRVQKNNPLQIEEGNEIIHKNPSPPIKTE